MQVKAVMVAHECLDLESETFQEHSLSVIPHSLALCFRRFKLNPSSAFEDSFLQWSYIFHVIRLPTLKSLFGQTNPGWVSFGLLPTAQQSIPRISMSLSIFEGYPAVGEYAQFFFSYVSGSCLLRPRLESGI